MKIIVDAMGGDNAPQAPVMGAIQANKEYGASFAYYDFNNYTHFSSTRSMGWASPWWAGARTS